MEEAYSQDITINDIAHEAHLSKYHFMRHFKATTGVKPTEYLRKIRMERAVWLLKHTNNTLLEIAKDTGFNSCNYFTKVFRAFSGVTPTQFRTGDVTSSNHYLHIEN